MSFSAPQLILRHGSILDFSYGRDAQRSAIANTTNQGCLGGGGLDAAVNKAGGPGLQQARRDLPILPNPHGSTQIRCPKGEARVTGPGQYGSLQVPYIIHAVGADYRVVSTKDQGDLILKSAYQSALKVAESLKLEAVAFPLLSTGTFRGKYALKDVVQVGLDAIRSYPLQYVKHVYVYAFGDDDFKLLQSLARDVSLTAATSRTNNESNDDIMTPFLVPTGTMHLTDVEFLETKSWKLTKKDSKRCTLLDKSNDGRSSSTLTSPQTARHRMLKIPVVASELVLYASIKKDTTGAILAKHIESNSMSDLDVNRNHRAAILTKGTIQFKKASFGIANCVLYLKEKEMPNVAISLFELRGVHVSASGNNIVTIAYNERGEKQGQVKETIRYVVYQTPEIGRFLLPIAKTVINAYIGVPQWAIPITWSGNLPLLPLIDQQEYNAWIGTYGGFGATVYAKALVYHVQHKIFFGLWEAGRSKIERAIQLQQPVSSGDAQFKTQQVIDVSRLANALSQLSQHKEQQPDLRVMYLEAGLHALAFNLVFRKLLLTKTKIINLQQRMELQNALGRALLYNVTLREVNFQSSDLRGFGETIGNAWAMNAQPLISSINFSDCNLSQEDLLGILRGLARIWCGGTALAQSISFANNPSINTGTWDTFFRVFFDPSTLSSWPKQPPPPPNVSFLQELDFRGTNAIGSAFVEFAERLTGLRSLKLSAKGGNRKISEVLSALYLGTAPLEKLEFEDIDISKDPEIVEALFQHYRTAKEITLIGFVGEACQLLCNWPEPVPKLSLEIGKCASSNSWSYPSETSFSPGTIILHNHSGIHVLAKGANGLKKLILHNTFYWQLVGVANTLAECGLKILHVYPPPNQTEQAKINKLKSIGLSQIESFWETLGTSKTLCDLQCPDQMLGGTNSNEIGMVGRFLKSNRSVQKIGFDHSFLTLNLEDVKILRSAFYGNKKVVDMQYLSKAKEATMKKIKKETDHLLQQVQAYKYEIKMLFKKSYSKHNRNWRDRPNKKKLPWIEKIRVAKRKLAKLSRDWGKTVSLLEEIMKCKMANQRRHEAIKEQKATEQLARREAQLKQLANKKKKLVTTLVTKLRKAKICGRQKKSAKMQIPRSAYYKSGNIWPKNNPRRHWHHNHSYYHYYNDPYHARYRGCYMSDDDTSNNVDSDDCDWLQSSFDGVSFESESNDPWSTVDNLIQGFDSNYSCATDSEYLALIHNECAELGIDVLEATSKVFDQCAAVGEKLDDLGTSTSISNDMLTAIVNSNLEEPFDLAAIDSNFHDIPEYDDALDTDDAVAMDADDVVAMDADDVVAMYAGAGPRDLDDGGASFGDSSNAALAGARRRARARKQGRIMSKIREKTNRCLKKGYLHLSLTKKWSDPMIHGKKSSWPEDFVKVWIEEAQIEQVKAFAESNIFDLPNVSGKSHLLLAEWSHSGVDQQQHLHSDIEVVLVTQCSLDRLPNLEAQLTCWTGKASIAVYLKPTQEKLDAIPTILSTIANAKRRAGKNTFDVALTLVEGIMEEESYPINYLRNLALLEARRQHLRFNASLEKSATLLVDVDFRPSSNLYALIHSKHAVDSILRDRKVVVCPAFEYSATTCPCSISSLKELVDKGHAEGFHLSHFPEGHGPTKFETFWDKSLSIDGAIDNIEHKTWMESYTIQYKDLFEPYVVMASSDVPLYDERFQGYGLNKVSHLATVSREKDREFLVLPGVFLVAPAHERSEAWSKIYGKARSDDKKFNQLLLKGLYYNFMKNLDAGKDPVVSVSTQSKQQHLLQQEIASKFKFDKLKESMTQTYPKGGETKYVACHC